MKTSRNSGSYTPRFRLAIHTTPQSFSGLEVAMARTIPTSPPRFVKPCVSLPIREYKTLMGDARTICVALKSYSSVNIVDEHNGTRPGRQPSEPSTRPLSPHHLLSHTVCIPCARNKNQVCRHVCFFIRMAVQRRGESDGVPRATEGTGRVSEISSRYSPP